MKNYMLHLRQLYRELKDYFWFMVDEEDFSITEAEQYTSFEWQREIIRLGHKGVCEVLLDHALWWF